MMMSARPLKLVGIVLLLTIAMIAMAVVAGDTDDPEFTDSAEDTTSNRASHDIVRGWITDENSTLTVSLEVTTLDAVSPVDDWRNLPNTIYEFYFTVEDKNYAARANIPVHGVFAAFASFSLHEYTGTGANLSYTSVDDQISGSYLVNGNVIEMTVNKADIDEPIPGDLITHIWAAAYFEPRGGDKEQVDKAMSYGTPGRNYVVTGSSSHFYMVELRSSNATVQAKPREAATFNITIKSTSTTDVEINITNSSLPTGYFVNFSRPMPILIPVGSQVSLLMLVSVPDNATNGTNVPLRIWATLITEDDPPITVRSEDLNLILQVRFIKPRAPEEEKGILGQVVDILWEYKLWIGVVAAIIVAAVVGFFIMERREKQDDHELLEYKAYLEAQREQRGAGGI